MAMKMVGKRCWTTQCRGPVESSTHTGTIHHRDRALSITFVGFSALVIILRQTLGGEMSKLDILITRIFIQLGFLVAAGALLPALLELLQFTQRCPTRHAGVRDRCRRPH
jgi:hypothetical protein